MLSMDIEYLMVAPTRVPFRICMWVVVQIMVPFWVLSIIRHLLFRGPKRGPYVSQPPMCCSLTRCIPSQTRRRGWPTLPRVAVPSGVCGGYGAGGLSIVTAGDLDVDATKELQETLVYVWESS